MTTFSVSLFANKTDNQPRPEIWTLEDLAGRVKTPLVRPEKDGLLFSGANYRAGATRGGEGVEKVSLLLLDYDHGADFERDCAVWQSLGFYFAAYTTHSSYRKTENNPDAEERFRIVLPLAASIPAVKYLALWTWAQKISGGRLDNAPKNAASIFYAPAIQSGAKYKFKVHDAALLDWRELALEESETRKISESAPANRGANRPSSAGLKPGEDYDARPGAFERSKALLIEFGCAYHGKDSEGEFFRRPGVNDHHGLHLFWEGNTHVFTSNFSPLQAGETYKPSRLYAWLRHNGDFKVATKALAAAGYGDQNRKYSAPPEEPPGLWPSEPADAEKAVKPEPLTESLFDGKLTIECEPAERGKARLVARNCASVLNRDVIALDRIDHRAQFVKALANYDEGQRQEIHQALLRLADRFDGVQKAIAAEDYDEKPVEKVISKILPDGRILEQIAGGQLAIYDPERGEVVYGRKVETDEAVYRPLDDDFIARGGLFLPEKLIEYGDEKTLDSDIETCINRYSDVPERERRLSARYVRLTYIADKLNEISYLRATGERGSGKSRYICTAGMLSLRPVLVTSPSAASLFRMMDAYQPTLTIDECNLATDSEDTQTLIQILNSGFQRIASVPRVEKAADGQQTIRMFSPFGPKLIGGLKLSESEAFESRCVAVKLQKTARKDIPFRMTERMLADFAALRAKLYLWRLRNLGRDFEAALDKAEEDLKKYQIEPRFVQIAIPIYGMISDDRLKGDFAAMMVGRTDDAKEEKKDGIEGQIVELIHSRLFDVDEKGKARLKPKNDRPKLEEGEPCEGLRVSFLVDCLNEGVPEKKKILDKTFSRFKLKPIGFKTAKLTNGAYKRAAAVVYSQSGFANIFQNFSLPVPDNFDVPVVPPDLSGDSKEFAEGHQESGHEGENSCRPLDISFEDNDLSEVGTTGTSKFPEPAEESFSETRIDAQSPEDPNITPEGYVCPF